MPLPHDTPLCRYSSVNICDPVAPPYRVPPAVAKPNALPPPVVPQCVGVNIHFTGQPTQDLEGLARGGFGWIRMDFLWDAIEKTKGVYDFSAYDSLLAGLTARHIKPLFILDYGNDLYEKGRPRTPEARAAFARFAAAAVRHFRGKTILWEIWNEPNGGFWLPKANVQEYGALALETARRSRPPTRMRRSSRRARRACRWTSWSPCSSRGCSTRLTPFRSIPTAAAARRRRPTIIRRCAADPALRARAKTSRWSPRSGATPRSTSRSSSRRSTWPGVAVQSGGGRPPEHLVRLA